MLVKIDRKVSIFETNPFLKNIPEFADLNERQMRYVAWYADYESPYRFHPDLERKRLCALEAGWTVQDTHQKTLEPRAREVMNGEVEKVNVAIIKYRSLKPNEDRELLALYSRQIENIKAMIETPTVDPGELKKRNDLILSLPDLRASQRQLAKMAGMEDELSKIEEEVKESRKMSTIDKVHQENLKE